MPFVQKHAALLALAVAVILVLGAAIDVHARKNDGTFYLKDISGSREALDGVTISGELSDGYQRTVFRLADGRLDTHSSWNGQPEWLGTSWRMRTGSKTIPGRFYNVQNEGGAFSLSSHDTDESGSSIGFFKVARVSPPLSFPNGALYSNQLNYGIAVMGERVFYTVPAAAGVKGKSIIYEVNFYDWAESHFMQPNEYESRAFIEYSLASEKAPHRGISVLGLEAVGDKLVLLTEEDETLRIRSYDSAGGALLGDARLPDFREDVLPTSKSFYRASYLSDAEDQSNRLFLRFQNLSLTRPLLLSVNLTDGAEVESAVRMTLGDEQEEDSFQGFTYARERNGKLYVMKTVREINEELPGFYRLMLPLHAYIFVYEDSRLIYQGEFVTDLNDDSIELATRPDPSRGISEDPMRYRAFRNLAIE